MNLQVRFGQVVCLQTPSQGTRKRHARIQRGTLARIAIAQARLPSNLFDIVNATVIYG